jgi:hypothetical protein
VDISENLKRRSEHHCKKQTRFKLDGSYTIEFEKGLRNGRLEQGVGTELPLLPMSGSMSPLPGDGTANYTGVHIYVNARRWHTRPIQTVGKRLF